MKVGLTDQYRTTVPQMSDKAQSRIVASLLAFACGDALGATVEFMHPDSIREAYGVHKDIIGGGWLELEPGEITDDTEMSLCVVRSIMEYGFFSLKDIADRFVAWYDSNPSDIGSTCRLGIYRYIKHGTLEAPLDDRGAGNGGVMRALPLILYFANDRDLMMDAVVAQSRLTHNNKESDEGCRCYSDMVTNALSGASKDDLRLVLSRYPAFAAELYDGKSGGYVIDTLRTVFHFFFTTETLEENLIAVVNRGEDADTTGALAGGLAGAFYDQAAIPKRWLDVLNHGVISELVCFAGAIESLRRCV